MRSSAVAPTRPFSPSPLQVWREARGLDRFELASMFSTLASAGGFALRIAKVEAGFAEPAELRRLWEWLAGSGFPEVQAATAEWFQTRKAQH